MRISDWSSDVCSSDLEQEREPLLRPGTDNIEEIARALERVGTIGAAGIARIAQIVVEIILVPAAPEHAEDVVEMVALDPVLGRSEARRVGNECVSTCRSLWSPHHKKTKNKRTQATK